MWRIVHIAHIGAEVAESGHCFASDEMSPFCPTNCPNRKLGFPRCGCLMATAGDDAVAIPDYVAIGVLMAMILFAVARLFVRGNSETRQSQSNFSLRSRTKFIEPCLPSPAKHPPDGPNWIHEISHDGFRIMAWREATDVELIIPSGNDLISRFPHIAVAVAGLHAQSCLIDGEVIVCDPTGLAVFDLMLGYRAIASTVLCAFDLLELNGEDLRCKPIESRKDALNQLLRRADAAGVVFNQHYKADGETLFRTACRLGRPGIVSKRLGSPYRSGRSKYWVKVKNPKAPAVTREGGEDWSR